MSIVLPPAELLVPLAEELLLLLQPTAAKAIAAKAAIAVVRLIIFLSLIDVVRLPQALTRFGLLQGPAAAPGMNDLTRSFAAGPALGSIPARVPGRTNIAASTSADEGPGPWRRAERSASICRIPA